MRENRQNTVEIDEVMNIHEISDEELYLKLRHTKREAGAAFSVLYDRHAQRLYAYCCTILKDEESARDVLQESLAKLYEMSRRGDEVRRLPALLLRIARNRCLDELQKKSRRTMLSLSELELTAAPRQGYEQAEMQELIKAALNALPEDCREAFLLKEHAELSYREIGEATGVSLSAARSRIFRARRTLREILAPYRNDLMS